MKTLPALFGMLMFAARLSAAPPAAYFDALDTSQPPPEGFMVWVPFVEPGNIADGAGLRAGDWIAGINGMRTRCRADLFLLRRRFAQTGENAVLHVARDGQWADVTVPNRDSIRTWTSFRREDPDAGTALKLILQGVKIETLPTYDTNPVTGEKIPSPTRRVLRAGRTGYSAGFLVAGLVTGLQPARENRDADYMEDRFQNGIAKFGHGAQPWHALTHSNFRMQEALCALAEEGGEENLAWAGGLVQTLCLLLLEDFDAAAERVAPLLGHKTGTFLDSLALFYAAVAGARAELGEGDDWQQCGVDADYFAFCYPWPTLPKKHAPDVFAFLPELQEGYNLRLQDHRETSPARARRAQALLRRNRGSTGLGYRMQVAAALVDGANHGGWPYRSADLWRNPAQVLKGLKENWENHPGERNLTALALVAPAARMEDEETLRLALRHVYTLGHGEIREAHFILKQVSLRLDPGQTAAMYRAWHGEERAAVAPPKIYAWLETRAAIAHTRLQRSFIGANHLPDSAGVFQANPWFIAEALRRGNEPGTLQRLLEAPETPARELRRNAAELLRQYGENYYWTADPHPHNILSALLRHAPQEAAFHHMLSALKSHDEYHSIDGVSLTPNAPQNPWMLWLAQSDAAAHKAAQDAAREVRGGADPSATLDNALRNAATPAALLVLAAAAREAGEAGFAQKFQGMAENFHRHGMELHRHSATSLWGARAFMGEPGHGAFAAELLAASAEPATRAWHALTACHALHVGEPARAQQHLDRALHPNQAPPPAVNEPKTLIFYGEILSLDAYAAKIREVLDATLSGHYGPMPPPPVPW